MCAAAPLHLARQQALTFLQALIAAVTLVAIGAVVFLSLFPLPEAPWRYLPYGFAGLVLLGTLSTVYFRSSTR